MLSDCNSAALIDRHGSVDWWCTPRFDSDSVFARLLDDDGGHFSIAARETEDVDRSYEDDSLVLRMTTRTASGVVVERVGLLMAEGTRGHDLGSDVPRVLARHFRCIEGSVELDVEFAPRFEYGLTVPLIHKEDCGPIWARGGPMTLVISTNADDATIERGLVSMTVRLEKGEEVAFALQAVSSWEPPGDRWSEGEIERHLDDTVEAWRDWKSHHQNYDGPYLELVEHSGRVLQGLTYQPTGAMVAAATTSLPEEIGGHRNWDYRYCWIRDAGFTLRALWVAACPDEAEFYLDYMTAAAGSASELGDLQIMYGIRGERDLTERPIPWLSGWRDSAPVRIGNGAWDQTQHDIYGELLLSVHHLREQFGELTDIERRLLTYLADAAAEAWKEPDHGIWEIRDEPRHYVHSKLMCWVALQRAIDMAGDLRVDDERVDRWSRAAAEVREAILDRGWSDEAGAFTQAFGSDDLDAAGLVIPMVGFLPFDDDRVRATVDAVRSSLVDNNGLVYRYRTPDGLPGEEGAFLLCTFWLAEALTGMGEVAEAREVFERAASFGNDLDLFSEEVDPSTGELLGNFPQAFSHVGLINAAWAITEAERGSESEPGIVI